MDYLIACPNCYRSQPWSGKLVDAACRRCGHTIPVEAMARALVHLFSTAAFDPPHDTLADEDGDELFRWIVKYVWGDAMRVGRHDWVFAGCPVTIESLCAGIRQLEGAAFDSLGRLLSAGTPPDVLTRVRESIAAAAVARLEMILPGEVVSPDKIVIGEIVALRERLYDILSRFPSRSAVPVLEELLVYATMDGDAEQPIGTALPEALQRCRDVTSPE